VTQLFGKSARARFCRFGLLAAVLSGLGGCQVKPEPLTTGTLGLQADDLATNAIAEQAAPTRPISLYEAFARALKYNLDHRVELMQIAVRVNELQLANYQMLPSLVANSGYAGRDRYAASSSVSILSGRQSLEPSYSSDRNVGVGDLTLSWNILDFGLSYVRAKQAANQALIAEEVRRRVVSRIIEDVRTAYWRAITSERLISRLRALEGRTERAIGDARKLYADRQTSPISALTYERELIEIKRESQRVEGELKIARSQLAALMNLPPDSTFRLSAGHDSNVGVPLGLSGRELVRVALQNRSEIREVLYRSRINEQEAEAALLELLPGINLLVGGNADSNSLLYNSNWVGWGARASWNAMRLFQYPERSNLIGAQDALLRQRALALTMAVITQVHVSRVRHAHTVKELKTAADFNRVQRSLLQQMRAAAVTEKISEHTLIREEMNALIAEVKYDLAHAALQNARANVYASLGLDTFETVAIRRMSVVDLAQALRRTWIGEGSVVPTRAANAVAAAK
jgi:outer membrane protein TolC